MRKQISKRVLFFALIALVLCVVMLTHSAYPANAQSGGTYDLTWNTFDGGGAMFSAGGSYSLGGTIGQADAGSIASGGAYALNGGFWSGTKANYNVFLPLILKV
jgi:hypothetical protein